MYGGLSALRMNMLGSLFYVATIYDLRFTIYN